MKRIGVRQLKNEATRIVREVREERAEYIVTVNGEPVATIRPFEGEEEAGEHWEDQALRELDELEELAERVGKAWKSPLSAAEAVAEQRREL